MNQHLLKLKRVRGLGCVLVLLSFTSCMTMSPERSASADSAAPRPPELLLIDNGTAKIGIDRAMGASITWLSWDGHPKNVINIHDPGRLIQQSYYAGLRLDRTADGQHEHWSPWSWNPIQGGGVGSWARVTRFKKRNNSTLYGKTIPKLWDMPNEEADAVMKQWTSFEPGIPNVIVVRNRITCNRKIDDRWGPAVRSPQEVPACYFTRNFDRFESYLGDGKWRSETQDAGPPWGRTSPLLKAMACFNAEGQGIAIFSPTSGDSWNFGPHTDTPSDDPNGGPCVHIAPVTHIHLGPKSTYEYRYWLVVGDEAQIAASLDMLATKYAEERGRLRS